MKAEFINPFLVSLQDVMKTMAQIELESGRVGVKGDKIAQGEISGLIIMQGPQIKGAFSITFEQDLVLKTYSNMLGEEAKKIDSEVGDMVGEITNMVSGGAKKLLAEKGYDFDMATPAVLKGKDHNIDHKVNGPTLSMPFTSEFGKAVLEICFSE